MRGEVRYLLSETVNQTVLSSSTTAVLDHIRIHVPSQDVIFIKILSSIKNYFFIISFTGYSVRILVIIITLQASLLVVVISGAWL